MELMESIEIAVRCEVCGDQYGVPAEVVVASQELLADGCPMRSPESCPAGFFGALVEPAVIAEVRRAWDHLAASAVRHGALGPVLRPLRPPPTPAERRDRAMAQRELSRWLDDGGR